MSQFVFSNNIKTNLAQAINSTATSIQLSSSANLPVLGTGQIMPITLNDAATGLIYEIMYCTAISGPNLTVTRGEEGTSAQPWAIGDIVFSGPTAESVAAVDGNPSQSFYGAPAQYENQFVTAGQIQTSSTNYAIDTGSPNVYQIGLTPAITGLTDGLEVRFRASNSNNGVSTLSVNGFSASLTQIGGNPLFSGEIVANGIYSAVYNLLKNRFELSSIGYGSAANQNTSSQTGVVAGVAGTTTVGHIATFDDGIGTIVDGGPPGVASARIYLSTANAGIVVGPNSFNVDTTAGAFEVLLTAAAALGSSIEFSDCTGTWATNNFTVNGNGKSVMGGASAVFNQAYETFVIWYNGSEWVINESVNLEQLQNDSLSVSFINGAFSGPVTVPNATTATEAVQYSQLGNLSGYYGDVTASTTLPDSAWGQGVQVAGVGIVLTLPSGLASSGLFGGLMHIYGNGGTGTYTIAADTNHFIYAPAQGYPSTTTGTTITITLDEDIILFSRGAEIDVIGGSWTTTHSLAPTFTSPVTLPNATIPTQAVNLGMADERYTNSGAAADGLNTVILTGSTQLTSTAHSGKLLDIWSMAADSVITIPQSGALVPIGFNCTIGPVNASGVTILNPPTSGVYLWLPDGSTVTPGNSYPLPQGAGHGFHLYEFANSLRLETIGRTIVANAVNPNEAVALGQANSLYAPTAGNSAVVFSAAPGTSGNEIVNYSQVQVGQSYSVLTASRALGTVYTNTTGKYITVLVSDWGSPSQVLYGYVNGVLVTQSGSNSSSYIESANLAFQVPNGQTYEVTGSNFNLWSELS